MDDPVTDEQLWSWIDAGASQLAEHLDRHPEDAERVASLRAAIDGVSDASRAPAPRLPERIGAYAIRGVLGRGAMGVVYEAEQDTTRRTVALKVVHVGLLGSERALAYFQREARVLARLSHPAIASIYEAGETDAGEPYFAMELSRGRSLDAVLTPSAGAAPPRLSDRVRLVQRIADAVGAAHEQGVIHRDLKPSNVLVDEHGDPKVLDFGLARFSHTDSGSLLSNPGSQRLVGTLPYMSPEQARGVLSEVDERSDVYALGLLLYEAVAGRRPYTVDGLSIPKAVAVICDTPPERIEPRPDADLETILERALEKDPSRRYADASELARDLGRYLDGEPIVARPAGAGERLTKWVVRRRIVVAAVLIALVAAVAGAFLGPADELGPDFDAPLKGQGYAKTSPFEGVRWVGDVPHVRVASRWYELEAIDDLHVHLVLGFCRQTAGSRWRKRFGEDLVETLTRMERPPGDTVALRVWDAEAGESVELPSVALTEANRQRVWEDHNRSPYTDVRWNDERPEVEFRGVWYGVRSVDGVEIDALLDRSRRMEPEEWQSQFAGRLAYVLIEALGESPGETVSLELVDLETGALHMHDAVPLSHALDRRVYANRKRRGARSQ